MNYLIAVMLFGYVASPLDSPCPVDWRGTPFSEAMEELAARLDVPYVLDTTVDAEHLKQPVRMSANHLTGAQAIRWMARSVGLSAAWRRDAWIIARSERIPATWRITGVTGRDAAADNRWATASEKRVAIDWLDLPLSRVADDISQAFGLDLIVQVDILEDQPLVAYTNDDAGIQAIRLILQESLEAELVWVDGALWAHRPARDQVPVVSSRPGESSEPGGITPEAAQRVVSQDVVVPPGIGDWSEFARCFGFANMVCDSLETAASYPHLVARGSLEEVLEGARLLGLITWQIDETGDPNRPTRVKVRVLRLR